MTKSLIDYFFYEIHQAARREKTPTKTTKSLELNPYELQAWIFCHKHQITHEVLVFDDFSKLSGNELISKVGRNVYLEKAKSLEEVRQGFKPTYRNVLIAIKSLSKEALACLLGIDSASCSNLLKKTFSGQKYPNLKYLYLPSAKNSIAVYGFNLDDLIDLNQMKDSASAPKKRERDGDYSIGTPPAKRPCPVVNESVCNTDSLLLSLYSLYGNQINALNTSGRVTSNSKVFASSNEQNIMSLISSRTETKIDTMFSVSQDDWRRSSQFFMATPNDEMPTKMAKDNWQKNKISFFIPKNSETNNGTVQINDITGEIFINNPDSNSSENTDNNNGDSSPNIAPEPWGNSNEFLI